MFCGFFGGFCCGKEILRGLLRPIHSMMGVTRVHRVLFRTPLIREDTTVFPGIFQHRTRPKNILYPRDPLFPFLIFYDFSQKIRRRIRRSLPRAGEGGRMGTNRSSSRYPPGQLPYNRNLKKKRKKISQEIGGITLPAHMPLSPLYPRRSRCSRPGPPR
jgi:hypothetical protein